MKKLYLIVLFFLFVPFMNARAQETNTANIANNVSVAAVTNKYAHLSAAVNKQSLKWLKRMQRQEEKLRCALAEKDSAKAAQLFTNSAASYQQLQDKLSAPLDKTIKDPLREYLPSLDSLSTITQFLQKVPGVTPGKLQQLNLLNDRLQVLQNKMQAANEIQTFIKEREQFLKEQLAQYGLGKQLLGINKTAYYYSQQVASYKELINDRKKIEEKLIATVRKIPAFKNFWQKNSILSRLFPMPDNYNTPMALTGLQTTSQVSSLVQQRIGSSTSRVSGAGAGAVPQQYVEQAQAQLSQLKDNVSQLGGTSGDMIMPDFKPKQRSKSFLKSLEYGINIQTQGTTNYLPTYTDVALTAGFKGFGWVRFGGGLSYKIGLGGGWNHIALTSEGVGLRTYVDIKTTSSSNNTISKLFGDIWLTAGQEYNYMQSFKSLRELHDNVNVWQKSFLAGITKRYPVGKKEGSIQFLYDFLANKQVPRSGSAFKFRVAYNF